MQLAHPPAEGMLETVLDEHVKRSLSLTTNSDQPDSNEACKPGQPDSNSSRGQPSSSSPAKIIVLRYFNLRFPELLATTWNTLKEMKYDKHKDLKEYY